MIEARELTKYYGTHAAIREVSFTVSEGEIVGFLGPNGAGKSTTMRILTGFLSPTSGTASIAGHDIRTAGLKAREELGYLPENTPLYPDMRVREFLAYRSRIKSVPRTRRNAAVDEAIERCRIRDVAGRMIGHLSKGYRQRVGLADCLLGRPRLMILDEPTVGLDPNQVLETRSLIQDIGRERTVFLSTHILHEVELVCQRVLIIHEGRIIAEGKTDSLCERYADHRTLALQVFADEDPIPALEPLKGIRKLVDHGANAEGARHIGVTCSHGIDPRPAISRLIAEKEWILQEMRLEPVRLEDIFAKLTADAAKDPVLAGAGPAPGAQS